MAKLEELQPHVVVRGRVSDSVVTAVSVEWYGSEALELTYKTPSGKVANELLYRHDEPQALRCPGWGLGPGSEEIPPGWS